MGFTRTQAKIYLTLIKLGETDARTLFKKANMPQPEVYRILEELERKGLVEKEMTTPSKFIPTPLDLGLQILMNQKMRQCWELQKKMKDFLRKNQSCSIEASRDQERALIVIQGKERLMQTIKLEHDNVQRIVDIISTLQRWSQILEFCLEGYIRALDRKANYRVIIEKPIGKIDFQENIQLLLSKPNFELRLHKGPLKINAAIFDEMEATINFFEGKPLGESSIIWTNHPGFIQMCQDHFDTVWKSSQKYKITNEKNL
jgi:sugar-specific transcriptional regulator TrmB